MDWIQQNFAPIRTYLTQLNKQTKGTVRKTASRLSIVQYGPQPALYLTKCTVLGLTEKGMPIFFFYMQCINCVTRLLQNCFYLLLHDFMLV